MKVKTLDNKEVSWTMSQADKSDFSILHTKARGVIASKYPAVKILEEVAIPIKRGKTLYLDFYIPVYNLAIEVDGAQHYGFSKHFHGTKRRYNQSMQNDYLKESFCELNNITLIRFKHFESIEQWHNLLL